jgi:hypothetical protein
VSIVHIYTISYESYSYSCLSILLELLEWRILENELIKNKLKSLKYIHHSIQNEILNLIQENIFFQSLQYIIHLISDRRS